MGVSKDLLAATATVRKLRPIVNKLKDLSDYFNDLLELVEEGVLTQKEIDEMKKDYGDSLNEFVESIIAEEKEKAEEIEESGEIEANNKVKNIVPIIQGSPVIIPEPTSYLQENNIKLSKTSQKEYEISLLKNQINGVI